MSLSPTLRQFLDDNGIAYEILAHERALTSARAAQTSHVPGDFLAKGVILKDEDRYLLAVLPASHHLRMGELARKIGRPLGLATGDGARGRGDFQGLRPWRRAAGRTRLWAGDGRRRESRHAFRRLLRGRRPRKPRPRRRIAIRPPHRRRAPGAVQPARRTLIGGAFALPRHGPSRADSAACSLA
jgi:hypothetical protein